MGWVWRNPDGTLVHELSSSLVGFCLTALTVGAEKSPHTSTVYNGTVSLIHFIPPPPPFSAQNDARATKYGDGRCNFKPCLTSTVGAASRAELAENDW